MYMGHCSSECQRLSEELIIEKYDAWVNDRPEPTMEDLLNRKERAKRWTPETMEERIEELRRY